MGDSTCLPNNIFQSLHWDAIDVKYLQNSLICHSCHNVFFLSMAGLKKNWWRLKVCFFNLLTVSFFITSWQISTYQVVWHSYRSSYNRYPNNWINFRLSGTCRKWVQETPWRDDTSESGAFWWIGFHIWGLLVGIWYSTISNFSSSNRRWLSFGSFSRSRKDSNLKSPVFSGFVVFFK